MKMMKIGLIGTGGRGHNAWKAHKPEQGWEIVAGADISPEAEKEFREKFPEADFSNDYHDVLKHKDIDAIFICTPDYCHEEHALAAIKAGKAIFLEKPMAITIEGCDRILKAAMKAGTKIFIGHNMRYFPAVLKMKEIADSGAIGEIQCGWCRHFVGYGGDAYFRDWHSEQKNTTGLLLQKGAHDIDVIHWIMGTYTKSVVGMGMLSVYNRCERRPKDSKGCAKWDENQYPPLKQTGFSPVIDVEDHNMVMMQMENGTQAAYLQCHYAPDAERNYTFIGTEGRMENIGDSDKCEIHVWNHRGPRATPDIIYKIKPVPGSHGGADPVCVQSFLDFVRDGKIPNTSPIAAREAVATGVLAHESMRSNGGRREIPPLPADVEEYFNNGQKPVAKAKKVKKQSKK